MRPLALIIALAFAMPASAAPKQPASDWPAVCHMLRGTAHGLIDPNQPIAVTLHRNGGAEVFRCNPLKADAGMKPAGFDITLEQRP